MIVKVCGLINKANVYAICRLHIDMIGINFYKPSKRYIGDGNASVYEDVPDRILRVGVFVNEPMDSLKRYAEEYKLDYLQLHGDESHAYGEKAAKIKPVIKVCRITSDADTIDIKGHDYASYLLLDTHHKAYGGSGEKFSWDILTSYRSDTPFLLSGGIGPEDISMLHAINHPQFAGVDINSRFEVSPGIKDASLVVDFVESIRS